MTETNNPDKADVPKKKMSLQEAIQKQLESKKGQSSTGKSNSNPSQTTKKMKSQQTKKVNNQRRRTGI